MAPCPLCDSPINTYRLRMTSDDEFTMCSNENRPAKTPKSANKSRQLPSLLTPKAHAGTVASKQTTQPSALPPQLLHTAALPPTLSTPTLRQVETTPCLLPVSNISDTQQQQSIAAKRTATVASISIPPTSQPVPKVRKISENQAHLHVLESALAHAPILDQTVVFSDMPSSSTSPTPLPPLSAAPSPDLSQDIWHMDSWMMPTTPPNTNPTMLDMSAKHPEPSSMALQSIQDLLLFDDLDLVAASVPNIAAHTSDFESFMRDLDSNSLDELLGGSHS
ncbi:hypothetical protein BG004_007606 [Podila humilis]|nr:hypothetical protein BG004_007606 [Podila humilis]